MHSNGSVVAMVDGTVSDVASVGAVKVVTEGNSIARISRREVASLTTVAELNRIQLQVPVEGVTSTCVPSHQQSTAIMMIFQRLAGVFSTCKTN